MGGDGPRDTGGGTIVTFFVFVIGLPLVVLVIIAVPLLIGAATIGYLF